MSKKTNFQTLPGEVRADRRRLAFKKLDEGWNKTEVAELVEVHYKTVETWLRKKDFLKNMRWSRIARLVNKLTESLRGNPRRSVGRVV